MSWSGLLRAALCGSVSFRNGEFVEHLMDCAEWACFGLLLATVQDLFTFLHYLSSHVNSRDSEAWTFTSFTLCIADRTFLCCCVAF